MIAHIRLSYLRKADEHEPSIESILYTQLQHINIGVNPEQLEQDLARVTIEALSKEGYHCAINAHYSQRYFHLDGVVLDEPASRDL